MHLQLQAEMAKAAAAAEKDGAAEAATYDIFGFMETATEDNDHRHHEYKSDETTKEMWEQLIAGWETAPQSAIRQGVRAGVPHALRGKVWSLMLDIAGVKSAANFEYADAKAHAVAVRDSRVALQQDADEARREWAKAFGTKDAKPGPQPSSELEDDGQLPSNKALKQINLDLDRTFYTHKDFMEKGGEGQTRLFHILAVYAGKVNPEVGYCQGMAFVAAVMLMVMDEEDAFWALVAVMENQKYLEGYYSQNLARVQVDADVFSKLVVEQEPELGAHLEQLGIHPLMYVTPWFMCVFTSLPCWDAVMNVWDLLVFRGVKTIMRVGLAIMQSCKAELLAMDSLGQLLPYLQHLPPAKMSQENLLTAVYAIDEAPLALILTRLDSEHVPFATPKRAPRSSAKRGRGSEAKATPHSNKRARGQSGGGSAAPVAPPTPSVFRRFMNSLATPLRARARMDGAETPMPRSRQPLRQAQSSSSTNRRSSRIGANQKKQQMRKPAGSASQYEQSPLLSKESPLYKKGAANASPARFSFGLKESPMGLSIKGSPRLALAPKGTPMMMMMARGSGGGGGGSGRGSAGKPRMSPFAGATLVPTALGSPLLNIPNEACSPSFGRSGVLSPNFAGTLMASPRASPRLASKRADMHNDGSPMVQSPIGNTFLTTATPAEKSSFRTFTEPTPRRNARKAKKASAGPMLVELAEMPVSTPIRA